MKTVRDGQKVWPTCPECGCRLQIMPNGLTHFWGNYPRDARGCECKYLGVMWMQTDNGVLGYHSNSNSPHNGIPLSLPIAGS